jgi:hypothetical protein
MLNSIIVLVWAVNRYKYLFSAHINSNYCCILIDYKLLLYVWLDNILSNAWLVCVLGSWNWLLFLILLQSGTTISILVTYVFVFP